MIACGNWRGRPLRLEHDGRRLQRIVLLQQADGGTPEPVPEWLSWLRSQLAAGSDAAALTWMDAHLDWQRSSDFRRQVLQCLRERVAKGQVCTYGTLANMLGRPAAARAVAGALAGNPFPILYPCHRVLPASGRLGGFMGQRRDSTGWKQALLDAEI